VQALRRFRIRENLKKPEEVDAGGDGFIKKKVPNEIKSLRFCSFAMETVARALVGKSS